jgi:two-component system sensor histidine kinase VicK
MAQQLKQSIESIQQERNVIAAERNKLSLVIAGIQDAIIAVDLNQNVTLLNRAAEDMIGLKLEEVVGQPIHQLFTLQNGTEEIEVNTYCPISLDGQEGVVYSMEKLRLKNSKKDIFINILTGKIRDGSTTNLGCIITMHNVSKEIQLEEMKLDFVSMAAHELRTPLTAVRGYLSVFMRENSGKFNDEQTSFLNRIATSTQRLASLVDNLLNVSKIERHGLNISPQPVDWPQHVKDLMPDFESYAKEQKVTLAYDEPTVAIPLVNIDTLKIDEVLSNLVTNAITYTRSGGHVHVTIEKIGNEVVTSIKDDGQGIPEDAVPHLFTKFFRVAGKLEQGSKGTGLGLYISKAIIELHKGRIWVETKVGKGSTFKFALPYEPV